MVDHIKTRGDILKSLKRELVGPFPIGRDIDFNTQPNFSEPSEAYGPFREAGSGQEILVRDSPVKRYGVGVLYPLGSGLDEENADETLVSETQVGISPRGNREETGSESSAEIRNEETEVVAVSDKLIQQIDAIAERGGRLQEESENDLDLSITNAFKPSSMGVSFLCYLPGDSHIK